MGGATDKLTIRLREPIERRSAATGQVIESIPEITLRAPVLGDMVRALDASEGGKNSGTMTMHLAAACAGLSVRDVEGLALDDGMRVFAAVMDFMPAGLPTAASGSPLSPANSASPPTGGSGGQPSSPSGPGAPLGGAGEG